MRPRSVWRKERLRKQGGREGANRQHNMGNSPTVVWTTVGLLLSCQPLSRMAEK